MPHYLAAHYNTHIPVVCAPMAGAAGGNLAAAVSTAGGLGMIGCGSAVTSEWIVEQAQVAQHAHHAYGIGLMAWALDKNRAPLEAVLELKPDLVAISFGVIEPYVSQLRAEEIAVATQVGTIAEARAAEQAGVDLIVARGSEAGGHGRDAMATLPLLQGVLDAVKTPVVAAGGIANGRGLAAVIAAGAEGAWVGTPFLLASEAITPPDAQAVLAEAGEAATAYGRVFDIGQRLDWPPEFGGRALRNKFFDEWAGREDELAADDKAAAALKAAIASRDYDSAVLYAGESIALSNQVKSAADVLAGFSDWEGRISAALR